MCFKMFCWINSAYYFYNTVCRKSFFDNCFIYRFCNKVYIFMSVFFYIYYTFMSVPLSQIVYVNFVIQHVLFHQSAMIF